MGRFDHGQNRHVVDQGQVDPFRRQRHERRELGKRYVEVQHAGDEPPEPSHRSELVPSGGHAQALNEAAQRMIEFGRLGDEALPMVRQALHEQRAEHEQLGEDVSDPLTNAHLVNQLGEHVEEEADTIAERRETQERFDQFVIAQFGGDPQRAIDELSQLTPDEYAEVLAHLNSAFSAESGPVEYGADGESAAGVLEQAGYDVGEVQAWLDGMDPDQARGALVELVDEAQQVLAGGEPSHGWAGAVGGDGDDYGDGESDGPDGGFGGEE